MNSKYIEDNKQYWGPEFAKMLGVEHQSVHDEIAAAGCYTVAFHIADNFRNGEFRKEILEMLGSEVK